ncbi:hypothetical protein F9K79_18830 [Ochrobactrum sp. Kaboul]|nr:hypothetical protein [Brucella anthropi]KAB2695367.1 hypothetical protein F9K79_18830 [Ochrobactrum sp. Kaboul]
MAYEIRIEQIGGGEIALMTLPKGFEKDPLVLADEMQRLCQKAYEMGRRDELEAARGLLEKRQQDMRRNSKY